MGVVRGISRPILVNDWTSSIGSDDDMVDGYDSPLTDLEDSSEYSSPEETFSESSGSEYGGETYKKQPAQKRPRTAKALDTGMAPAPKGPGRRKKTLSLIVIMPIDILLEIFGLLEPADLLYLSRTSKAFRKILLSNSAVSVWKAARVNRDDVPDCMPGMSEVTWANLLFGGSQCYVCGTKGITRIDFGIRRRVCTSCLKKNLVYKPNFSSKFPDFDPIIMDLIPFTNTGGWAHGHASTSKFFWSDDVLKMAAQLGMYQKDVHMFKPGAKKRLEDFKQSRKRYVDSVVDHAAVCNAWVDEERERHLLTVTELRSQNKELIKARLVQLGHGANDVARMLCHREYAMDKELTNARWKRLLPRIERNLSELKEEQRLEDQRSASFERKRHLLETYDNYVRQLRTLIPPSESFLKLYDVAEFINSPPVERESEIGACRAFVVKLPELCTRYIHQTKLALTKLLGPSTGVSQDTLARRNQGINVPDETLLQLATSIFQCISSRPFPLITWDKVQYHRCPSSLFYAGSMGIDACTFSLSQSGITAARSLLSLVDLDAKTTTATTMDQLQYHFFCSNCPPKLENGGSYRMAMDWRRSVIHYVEESHSEPRWELLSAEQLKVIHGSHPPEYPRATDPVWYCNGCDRHNGKPVDKAAVIDHLRWDGIAAPIQGVDFKYDMAPVELPPQGTKFFITPLSCPKSRQKTIVANAAIAHRISGVSCWKVSGSTSNTSTKSTPHLKGQTSVKSSNDISSLRNLHLSFHMLVNTFWSRTLFASPVLISTYSGLSSTVK
ncbi:uncharacterized protein BJ212DRAFT_565644 [Suillus subaureus]|uniref:F-box domain-containing protein n=1 Tax=Suillus subaureus TaxID=48587 RepID=A0A9P7E595_9AGAM|nr:uncharacterized protein BJ212DRAFT_565644 [Suillus subaureus]KAG1811284.1 hypothetical protein BJ212DRAFT_565644 [Suillus subaureus]